MKNILLLSALTFISFVLKSQPQVPPNWYVYDQVNSSMADERVYFLYYDSDNWIHWAATFDGGLTRINGLDVATFTTSNSNIPSNRLRTLTATNGLLWVGTKDNGIFSLDTASMTFTTYNTANSDMPDNECWGMTSDQNGNIWCGAGQEGLVRFDGSNWTIYNTSNSGIVGNWVNYITVDATGNVWAAVAGGFSKFDGTTWTTYNSGDYGRCVIQHSNGSIWMASTTRLTKLEGGILTHYTTSNSDIPDNDVSSLAEDTLGNIWLGTVAGGVAKFDGSAFTVYNTSNSTLPDNYIETIDISNYNTPWVGTNGGGLAGFREDNQIMSSVFEPNAKETLKSRMVGANESIRIGNRPPGSVLEVISFTGQLIQSMVISNDQELIQAPSYSGNYIVRITGENFQERFLISVY